MEQGILKREVSIFHGIMLIIGTVIGASSFILIGPLAGETGPGLWVAYALGAIPTIFVAVVFSQLGSAFPITGATYIAISWLLSSAISLIIVWTAILGVFALTGDLYSDNVLEQLPSRVRPFALSNSIEVRLVNTANRIY